MQTTTFTPRWAIEETSGPSMVRGKNTYRIPEIIRDALFLAGRRQNIMAIWVSRRLHPRLREEIMVAVSQANTCRY
ncbi:MAG: hypothetical protein ACNA8W_13775, partial [Bradymonadaceae bacterium]